MAEQLLAFAVASILVIVVPGPDMMLVLRNTARAGKAGAARTAAGILAGAAIIGAAAAVGITALLTASATLSTIVRIAGGLYLLFLGVQAVRSYLRLRRTRVSPASLENRVNKAPAPGARLTSFRQGLLGNLLNPKVAAFYLSLFPQFDLAPLTPVVQHSVLAGAFWVMCLAWYMVVIALLGRLTRLLQSPTFARRTEAVAGGALIGLGGLVLARAS